jgi:peptidoglycan/xylan/chitin deacetylase (PgdA/CDA1 family)
MRFFRPGFLAGWLYPEAIFRIRTTEKILFLTFDDGPDPASTPRLLDVLKTNDIKALFFCNGKESEKYPGLVEHIRKDGHVVGNHGYSHYDGWRTDSISYINDILKASEFTSDKIFRPPYGHLKFKQYCDLKDKFRIVLWDIMPYDFDNSFGKEKSLRILKNKIRPGSIIVLHDTSASQANTIISQFVTYALNSGYRFELLDVDDNYWKSRRI